MFEVYTNFIFIRISFYTNPEFPEVTLNSFIFVMNIFCKNPASKFGMIDITHGLVSDYYTVIVWVKSDR